MIKRGDNGRWKLDIEPVRGHRYRKSFDTKKEAMHFEAYVRQQHAQGSAWSQPARDNRRLSALVQAWYELHGHALRDGKRRYRALLTIAKGMGDPVASSLTGQQYSVYRARKAKEGLQPKTLNNHLGYLNAVFNELKALSNIHYSNPLSGVRALKVPERELSWLTNEQIQQLLTEIRERSTNPHVEIITRVCLATGARWSEAEGLTLGKLRNGAVEFVKTKSFKVRTVPVRDDLFESLTKHLTRYPRMSSSITAFRRALKRSGIVLPKGQAAHALRHTFASHFVMNGGNILVLQKILGHSSINMTMRYAHLAPDHLAEATAKGPTLS